MPERFSNDVPVFQESMAGALIDSARISVMAALAMLPPRDAPLIILPGDAEQLAEDAAGTVEGCLEQAMEWLDAARAHTVAVGAPVTSLHIAGAPIRNENATASEGSSEAGMEAQG